MRLRAADDQERTTVPRARPTLAVADVDVQRAAASLAHLEFDSHENVIIDTSQLNSADLAALWQALIDEGILGTKVLVYP